MKWFAKLERRLGKFAIRNLMMYLMVLYVIGTLIFVAGYENVYYTYLALNPEAILKRGQVWRIVTFLMMPPGGSNVFFMLISLYVYWNLGSIIERYWGAFKFNVYMFTGIFGTILATFIVYFIYGSAIVPSLLFVGNSYINFSLFLAYAFTFPDAQFLLFFIIPIKAKILGWIEILVYVVIFITGTLADRIMIVVSLINVIIFFLATRNFNRFKPSEIKRRRDFKKKIAHASGGGARHKCAICGRTDEDDPNLTFRFCSKCEGNFEYCQDHLYTHTHVTKEDVERLKTKH
ncbi:MAG: rhomboid family intramembrane serine protease [Lachnospiraceae bacterium]|nr:rhomboid family intramembrane serine protease [Lachnospiraceae bacterium]